jgi:hypothetical protein
MLSTLKINTMDHGVCSRYTNVSPISVASIVDSSYCGTGLNDKVLPSFSAKDSGYVREGGTPHDDTMDVLDPAIEYGDFIVDLSNLVSSKRLNLRNLPASAPKRSLVKKQRSYRRLYPTINQVRELPDIIAADILANCRNRRARMEKLPSYSRLSKTKLDYGSSLDLRGQSLPGVYKCSPTKNQPIKIPPTEQSHYNAAGDTYSKHMQEQVEWDGCHYAGIAAGGGYHSAMPSLYDEQPQFGSGSGPPQNGNHQLEISPGVFAPLRGSDETWNAIERGFSSNVDCFVCSADLICIADADYVLCPECRVVGPTGAAERKLPPTRGFKQPHRGGVGLGLKVRQATSPASMPQY